MFKRLMFGLFAVGLVAVFTAETANGAVGRYRRSVENLHKCETALDPCYGAESVTDILYGWDGTNAICNMTGRVFCDPLDNGEICSDADSNTKLTSASFSNTATFDVETASDLTVLDAVTGQMVCDTEYPEITTVFNKFWPNAFVAHSTYKFPTTSGKPDYELIERCLIQTDDPKYSCITLWDSTSQVPPLHLPCCGESNTLTVNVIGSGTVVSDPAGINCGNGAEECVVTYDGTTAPIDQCPVVVLTATPLGGEGADEGWVFTGYSGDCSGTDPCTVTPAATVMATFEPDYFTLTVQVNGDGANDRAWIFDPRSDFDSPPQFYCYGHCTKKVDEGTRVVIKKKGGKSQWGGVCEGVPNSVTTCDVVVDASKEIIVNYN